MDISSNNAESAPNTPQLHTEIIQEQTRQRTIQIVEELTKLNHEALDLIKSLEQVIAKIKTEQQKCMAMLRQEIGLAFSR
jgi:hypothetical protein